MVVRRILAFVLILSVSQTSWARHTDDSRLTDGTAFTLNHGEYRAGLFTLEAGLFDRMELGTIYWLWLVKASNLFTKVKLIENEHGTTSITGGVTWVNAREYSDENPDVTLYAANFGIFTSRIMSPYTVSMGVVLTELGHTELRDEDLDIGGAIKGTGGVLRPQVEYRLSDKTALVLDGNIRLFQTFEAGASSTVQVNDRVTWETFGNTEIDVDEGLAFNVTGSAAWSWDTFNLRVGYRWGDLSLPIFDIFIPQTEDGQRVRRGFPVVDMYWRF